MRIEQSERRSSQAEDRTVYAPDTAPATAMTPARRAALEALEREFRDLLQGHPR